MLGLLVNAVIRCDALTTDQNGTIQIFSASSATRFL